MTLLGSDVNLGNIQGSDVISLESLRRGLRSDTFRLYLARNRPQ
ncbi:phosphosulfolactate synthase [Klebsiella pneumoniae]